MDWWNRWNRLLFFLSND